MYRETVECDACNARKAADAMSRRRHWGVLVGAVTFAVSIYSAFVLTRPEDTPGVDVGRKIGSYLPMPALMDPDPMHWSARDPRFDCHPGYVESELGFVEPAHVRTGRTEAFCSMKDETIDPYDLTYELLHICEVDMDPEVHGHFAWLERKSNGACPKSPPARILWALGAAGQPDATVVGRK